MNYSFFEEYKSNHLHRVGFFGDSLTHLGMYPYYIELWNRLRHPEREFHAFNGGVAGMSAHGARHRLIDEFLARKPNGIFFLFGANDIGRVRYFSSPGITPQIARFRREVVRQYEEAMTAIVAKTLEHEIPPLLSTPFPYDEYGIRSYPAIPGVNRNGIAEIAAATRRVAEKFELDYIELFDFATALLEKNPNLSFGNTEPVHPGDAGQLYIAALFLEAAGEAARPSAAFDIDLETTTIQANECRIDAPVWSADRREVNFTFRPKTLPFPQLPEVRQLELLYPFNDKLNRESWRLRNLPAGHYRLFLSGEPAGVYSADELAAGINGALLPSNNLARAEEAAATLRRIQANDCRMRDIVQAQCMLDIQFPDTAYIVYNELNVNAPCPMDDDAERLRRYRATRKIVEDAPELFYPPYFIALLDLVRDGVPGTVAALQQENEQSRTSLRYLEPEELPVRLLRLDGFGR